MKKVSKPAGLAAAVLSLVCAGSVYADTITAVVGGSAQGGATYVSFDGLTPGQTTPYSSGALTVDFTGNAQTESSGVNNGSASPLLSGNNNLYFGAIYAGGDNTTYLAAGTSGNVPPGSITFNFATAQNYFGLLWGSVDANNTLTFYSGANGTGSVLDTITGTELNALNSVIAQTGYGDIYDAWGTAYVNVDIAAGFESVVATTGTFTFELDNVAYGSNSSVPDVNMTAGLLGGALVGLQMLRRKLFC